MSDEEKVNATGTGAPEAPVPAGDAAVIRKPKKWPIVISVFAVLAVAVLVAVLHWHEEPTFCNLFCHQPMDRYVEGYYSGDMGLEAAVHEENGVTCLGCHWPQAKMMDLVHEVVMWVSDGFTDPLPDETGIASEEFCGKCHDGVTAPTKESATEGWEYDPHNIPEDVAMHQTAGADGGAIVCSDCHKAHKASTLMCAECHSDYFNEESGNVPEGWVIPAESEAQAATAETYGIYDPHAGDTYVQLSKMHETAGSDGGVITCADCHDTQTIVCAQCHEDVFTEENTPEGWTLSVNEARAATAETYGVYDPHSSDYVQFSPMHETAGSDGGVITCNDCHETQTIACAMCHLNTFKDSLPEGWSVPEGAFDKNELLLPRRRPPRRLPLRRLLRRGDHRGSWPR